MLVENWKSLWKATSMWFAAAGVVLPEIMQFAADNTSLMVGVDDSMKSWIRLGCLAGVIVCRPFKQKAVSGPAQ